MTEREKPPFSFSATELALRYREVHVNPNILDEEVKRVKRLLLPDNASDRILRDLNNEDNTPQKRRRILSRLSKTLEKNDNGITPINFAVVMLTTDDDQIAEFISDWTDIEKRYLLDVGAFFSAEQIESQLAEIKREEELFGLHTSEQQSKKVLIQYMKKRLKDLRTLRGNIFQREGLQRSKEIPSPTSHTRGRRR